MGEIESVFPLDLILTPRELARDYNGSWPSVDTLTAKGKQVVVSTGYDYGPIIDSLMFSKYAPKLFSACMQIGWAIQDLHRTDTYCMKHT